MGTFLLMTAKYKEIYQRSIKDAEGFWSEVADEIFWYKKPTKILNSDKPPFHKWFQDGTTNTCYNAIDLHVKNGKGNKIAMPQPLYEDGVEYTDGTVATPEQMAHDVTMFLTWAAEPKLEARKRIGFKVISYLIILSFLLYFTNRRIWKDTH